MTGKELLLQALESSWASDTSALPSGHSIILQEVSVSLRH